MSTKVTLIINDGKSVERYEVEQSRSTNGWTIPLIMQVASSAIAARPEEIGQVQAALRVLSDFVRMVSTLEPQVSKQTGGADASKEE